MRADSGHPGVGVRPAGAGRGPDDVAPLDDQGADSSAHAVDGDGGNGGPGDVVAADLINAPPALRRRLPLEVLHSRTDPDGGYLAGCKFPQPLSESEVGDLVVRL